MLQHMFHVDLKEKGCANVVFDTGKRIVHVLELDHGNNVEMSGCIEELKQYVQQKVQCYSQVCHIERWFIYDKHGTIKQLTNGQFEEIRINHPDVNKHFASKMKIRLIRPHHKVENESLPFDSLP